MGFFVVEFEVELISKLNWKQKYETNTQSHIRKKQTRTTTLKLEVKNGQQKYS
jgi:hypothetical protein